MFYFSQFDDTIQNGMNVVIVAIVWRFLLTFIMRRPRAFRPGFSAWVRGGVVGGKK